MRYQRGIPRVIRENGQTVVRLRSLIGRVPVVSFVPEDLSLVKGEPEQRRHAINLALSQVDAAYAKAQRTYQEILKSRNAALKQCADGFLAADAIDPWDDALVKTGLQLFAKRAEFTGEFSERLSLVHRRISGGKETVELHYRPSFPGPWDESADERWRAALRKLRPQELALGVTLTGPQRDDAIFVLDGRGAREFASEGQKRTCAVAFKLAEVGYIHDKLGQRPLCLLDDVLSELDHMRAEHLLEELSQTGQCFVTLTGLESWPKPLALPASIFRVDSHGLTRETKPSPGFLSEDRQMSPAVI
jgi:DNA replication and repair protein RecF